LRQSLRELGYVEGQNLAIEWRWKGATTAGYHESAAELVALKPDAIVVLGAAPQARAVKEAANDRVPIVFSNVGDPVALGLVRDLARPGGNLTGVNNMSVEITAKRLELLKDLLPRGSRIAVLSNPSHPLAAALLKNARAAAQTVGVEIEVVEASTIEQLREAFARAQRERAAGVLVAPDPFFYFEAARIARLALDTRLPSVFELREWVEAGGYSPTVRASPPTSAVLPTMCTASSPGRGPPTSLWSSPPSSS
jgi:putative ABC transport system substrate-binding protein